MGVIFYDIEHQYTSCAVSDAATNFEWSGRDARDEGIWGLFSYNQAIPKSKNQRWYLELKELKESVWYWLLHKRMDWIILEEDHEVLELEISIAMVALELIELCDETYADELAMRRMMEALMLAMVVRWDVCQN